MREPTTLELTAYERDNLLALIIAVSGYAGASPLSVANNGDWVMMIGYKLAPSGALVAADRGLPNRSAEQIVAAANELAAREPSP